MTPLQLEADLLHILLKGLALSVALFALALIVLRGRSAHTTSLFWRAAMVGLLAIPAISLWIPWLQVAPPAPSASSPPTMMESVPLPPPVSPEAATTGTELSLEAASPHEAALPVLAPSLPAETQPVPPLSLSNVWRPHLVIGLWLAGALAVMGRWLWSWSRVRGLVQRAVEENDPEWMRKLSHLGMGKEARIMVSPEVPGPMVCGLVRPVIVVPPDAREWPADKRRQILAHELSHIRRRDPAWLLAARIAVAIHWPNPLVWLAAKRLRLADEQCADDAVLEAGGNPAEYASLLTSFARHSTIAPHLPTAVAPSMAGVSTLRSRVQRVLDPRQQRGAPQRIIRFALPSLVAGLVLIAGGLSPTPAKAQEPGEPSPTPEAWSGPTILEGSDENLFKARNIVIPSVHFDETTLGDAVDFLRSRSCELDTFELDPTRKGLNFVVLGPEIEARRVPSLRLRNVPIASVLEFVCRQTGTSFEIGPDALAIMDRGAGTRAAGGVEPTEPVDESEEAVMKKLKRIVVPKVELIDATLADAVEFLRQQSEALDVQEKDASRKGLNFVIKGTDLGARKIKALVLNDISLDLIMRYVCMQTDTAYKVDEVAVWIVDASIAAAGGDQLVTRTWHVPPTFPLDLETRLQEDNPFADPGDREGAHLLEPRRPLLEVLREHGIDFQAGATATYKPQTSQLVVRARPANLELVDALVQEMFWPGPKMVNVRVELYEVPKAEALAILRKDGGQNGEGDAYQSVKELVDRGQASLLMVRSAKARPGQLAKTQSGSELQHVTSYEEKDGKDIPVVTTTLVGSRIEVEPNLGANDEVIDVRYSLHLTRGEPKRMKGVMKAPVSGRELEVENVVIETLTLSQGITILYGREQLLGTMQSSSNVEDAHEILAFLTATVAEVRR